MIREQTARYTVTGPTDTPAVYTVSRLNRLCRFLLSETFGSITVEGEISNFTAASSGHLYFTLKDSDAQVRCAMFKPQARLSPHRPQNGDHVQVKAQVSLYEPRGDYQLIVERIEPAGDGALALAFERLKQKLASEGLFDQAHKQPLPALPRTVGVITSPSGAAIRDILSVLKRRFPAIEVILFPVKVQGAEARDEIVHALRLANRLKACDVLIVGRGGGSSEDLWTFNEEAVVRAIYASQIPVVAAIGHEIDITLSDFVADLRAPTPSAAAEAISPDQTEWGLRIERLAARLARTVRQRLAQTRMRTEHQEKRLGQLHPAQRLHTQLQRLDELELRLNRSTAQQQHFRRRHITELTNRLLGTRPEQRLHHLELHCTQLERRLATVWRRQFEQGQQRVLRLSQTLHGVSPLATLARGYSITRRADTGAVLLSSQHCPPGTRLLTQLADGELLSTVEAPPDTRSI